MPDRIGRRFGAARIRAPRKILLHRKTMLESGSILAHIPTQGDEARLT